MKEIYYDECYPSKYGVRKKYYHRRKFKSETIEIVIDETTWDDVDYSEHIGNFFWEDPDDLWLEEIGYYDK